MMVRSRRSNSQNTQVRVLIPVTVFDRWLAETGQRAAARGTPLDAEPLLGPPETWMVPEAAVSNPARSSRRCSSPSTVDSAARRACYEQPGPALPGGRVAAVRVRGPNLGEYADSLVANAQVRATLATISDDAYNEYLDLRSLGRDA